MATENKILTVSYAAAEDLSQSQFCFVVLDNGKVRLPADANEAPLGVLQNAPTAGEAAAVCVAGICKVEAAENIWANTILSCEEISGKAQTGQAGQYARAIALEDGEVGDLIPVLLLGPLKLPSYA
ncbi:MAG: hypothetical protein Kow0037_00740 [Calditrichia bacterium]